METKLHESVSQWISQLENYGHEASTVTLTGVFGSTAFFETKLYGPIQLIVPTMAIPDCVSSEMDLSESSDVFLVTSTAADGGPQALHVLNEKLERIRPSSHGALNAALGKLFPELSMKQNTLTKVSKYEISNSRAEIIVISDDEDGKNSMYDHDGTGYGSDDEDMWVAAGSDDDDDVHFYGYEMASLDSIGAESHELRSKQGYLYAMAKEAKQLCETAHGIDIPFPYNSGSTYHIDCAYHMLLPWCLVIPSIRTYNIHITLFFGGFVSDDAALKSLGIPTDLPIKLSLKFDKKYWHEQKKHSPCIDGCLVSVMNFWQSTKAVDKLKEQVVEFPDINLFAHSQEMKKYVLPEERELKKDDDDDNDDDKDKSKISKQKRVDVDDDDGKDDSKITNQKLYGTQVLLPELVKTYFDFMAKSGTAKHDLIPELQIFSNMANPLIGLMCFLWKRLNTLTSWCVVCWNNLPHKVSRIRTCNQELCLFKFEEIGLGASVLHEVKHAPVLVDFELSLALAAANDRTRDVFEPFPGFLLKNSELRGRSGWFSSNNLSTKRQRSQSSHTEDVSNNSNKKLDVLRSVLLSYPPILKMQKCSTEADLKKLLSKAWDASGECGDEGSCLPYDVFRFLVSTNRLTMCPLDGDEKLDFPDSIYQFAILYDNPEKEAYFENRRAENGGSFFAFHGSGVSNWFSILRNGLRSMSGTQYMSTGAALGHGIYIASNINTSVPYSRWNKGNLNSGFGVLAICEIINGSLWSGQRHLDDNIMVVRPECEQDIVIRYVLVFKGYQNLYHNHIAIKGNRLTSKSITIDLSAHHKSMQDEYQKKQEDKQRVSMEARWCLASLIWKNVKQKDEDEDTKHPENLDKETTMKTTKLVAKKGNSCAAPLSGNMQAIQKELKSIMKQINDAKRHGSSTDKTILAGIEIELLDESNLCKWHVHLNQKLFKGSMLYKDLKERAEMQGKQEMSVKLECVFPNTFPMSPPFIRIVSPRFSFHTGHVTVGGSICMELLTDSGWSPAFCFESVLVQIVHAMIEGGGRLDKNSTSEYGEREAREAYVRVARQHGWMK